MTTPAYDIGDLRRLKCTFSDLSGAPADPTTVVVTIREPDGALAAPTPVSEGAGVYRVDFAIAKAGRHVVRWEGDGAVETAAESEFWARRQGAAA